MSENKPKTTSTPKKSNKSTKAEINQRVSEVADLLMDGYTRSYIQQYGSKWAVNERQVDEYIAQATAQIKEINSTTLQDNLALICSNLWDVFRKAKKAGDLSEQHKILNSIAKIRGLEKYTVNHVIEDKRELADMSDEDLDKLLNGDDE